MHLDILVVTPEIAPVSKVGGIADGIAGLSRALRRFGHAVTVALPRWRAAERVLVTGEALDPVVLPEAGRTEPAVVPVLRVALEGGVELLLLEIPGVPEALGPYGDDIDGDPENARRFGLFARAVIELARRRAAAGRPWQVLHAHEWPAALVPYLARERRAELGDPRIVFTIHTLAFQGIFPLAVLPHLGLGPEHLTPARLEFHGRVNLMKAGLLGADAVTTVSPTYAREIIGPELGEGLDGVLRSLPGGVVGITNGVDTQMWDPRADATLAATYGPEALEGKAACKRALAVEVGIEDEPARPLVVSVGRVFEQKGSDFLVEALPGIVAAGASVVVAGAGSRALEAATRDAVARFPGQAAYVGFAEEAQVHRILAGGDVFVMPSRFEPCGLVQMYAQRYGTVPVARRTGGLVDTIADASPDLETGTGFLFDEASGAGLLTAVRRALAARESPGWVGLRRRIMALDPSWSRPARRYEQVYVRLRGG